jgi:hypothetical protein
MSGEAVTPMLLECLEPPDITNIERSFQSLHDSSFITQPSDDGEITSLGSLAVSLGYVHMHCALRYLYVVFLRLNTR